MFGTSLAYGFIINTFFFFFNAHQPQLANSIAVNNVLNFLLLTQIITKTCFDN